MNLDDLPGPGQEVALLELLDDQNVLDRGGGL